MSQDHSDHATNAAVDEQSSVETPYAAESVSPSPLAADVNIDTDTVEISADRERATPRAKPKANRRSSGKTKSDNKDAPARDTPTLSERLLARFVPPRLALDRQHVPPPLLGALDAAGLATPELLAPATFTALATIGAVAGPNVRIEIDGDGRQAPSVIGLSLRVAVLTDERCPPVVPAPILGGAFAVENDALGAHQAIVERHREQKDTAARRHALHRQAVQAAERLGIAPPPLLVEDACDAPGARPRIVLAGGTYSAIRAAAAGGTDTLVIHNTCVPSMAHVGNNHDEVTDTLLNALCLGHQVPVADPDGRTVMRTLPAGVIGVLSTSDCALLHKAHSRALAATVFVTVAPHPVVSDNGL